MSIADAQQYTTPLINAGIAGAVLWWFMARAETRLRAVEDRMTRAAVEIRKSMDRLSRANLLLTVALHKEPTEQLAREMLAELEEEQIKSDRTQNE